LLIAFFNLLIYNCFIKKRNCE